MKCLECNKEVKSINYLHLKKCCGLLPREYKKKHPGLMMEADVIKSCVHRGEKSNFWKGGIRSNKELWIRKCPTCDRELRYSSYHSFSISRWSNSKCYWCPDRNHGYKHSEETKLKISKANKGKDYNNSNLGKTFTEEHRLKISMGNKGRKPGFGGKAHSLETRTKQRLARVEDLLSKFGSKFQAVNYNKNACKLFNTINKEMNWNGMHAENGGEFRVDKLGYWLDYYEPTKNIVIEFDEKRHLIPSIAEKDKIKEKEVIDLLGCKFFRIPEGRESNWKDILGLK